MIRTDQKTNSQKTSSERKNLPERERGRQNLEPLLPGQALQALLAGAGPDRLSPEAVLALSHTVGNSAMLEMVSRRGPPLDRDTVPIPGPIPEMKPAVLSEGSPELMVPNKLLVCELVKILLCY